MLIIVYLCRGFGNNGQSVSIQLIEKISQEKKGENIQTVGIRTTGQLERGKPLHLTLIGINSSKNSNTGGTPTQGRQHFRSDNTPVSLRWTR